jgi:hypothetical protein
MVNKKSVIRQPTSKISDRKKVRLGGTVSPLPVKLATTRTADPKKVRLGGTVSPFGTRR